MNIKTLFRSFSVVFGRKADAPHPAIPRRPFLADESTAMKVSAAYSAVKLISEGVAILPLEYQRYNAARRCYEPQVSDNLFTLLSVAPNKRQTSFEFWREAIRQVLLLGNAYILPFRNTLGELERLILCSPGAVTPDVVNDRYIVTDSINGVFKVVRGEDILVIRNIGIDGGYTGLSAIALAAASLGINVAADESAMQTLSNGGLIKGFVSGASSAALPSFGAASRKQMEDLSRLVEEDLRAGKQIIPMSAEAKFQPLAFSPADAKVLESKQMSIREIARFFRVHPELLYEGTNNTYKSSEVPNVMFLHQTLVPLLTQIEQQLRVKLLPKSLWGTHRLHFDREAMYLTDLTTEVAYIRGTIESGVYTVNDWRAKKGLPPVARGDTSLVSANLKALDALVSEARPECKQK